MSASGGRNGSDGLVDSYKERLESRIRQGEGSLVCNDPELRAQLDARLSGGSAPTVLSALGLDALSVMEASLRARPATAARCALDGLARAFEVLELAAVNLYLSPWRKEYRLIKTFSGVFTHHVRRALTREQAVQLFGLLGYQLSDNELKLNSVPVAPETLLCFACMFFAARVECGLLGRALGGAHGPPNAGIRLIQQRREGQSLQVALERLEQTAGTCSPDGSPDEEDLDLYTADTESNGPEPDTSVSVAPPLHTTPGLSPPHHLASRATPSQGQLCVSTLTCQLHSSMHLAAQVTTATKPPCRLGRGVEKSPLVENRIQAGMLGEGSQPCDCLKLGGLYISKCHQCRGVHLSTCPVLLQCTTEGHQVALCNEEDAKQHAASVPQPPPRTALLRKHSCLKAGREANPEASPEGDGALHPNTEEARACEHAGHEVAHQCKLDGPMPFHSCCTGVDPMQLFACLVCRVFHVPSCDAGRECHSKHERKDVSALCSGRGPESMKSCDTCRPYMLCRFCCARYCKECWYPNPLSCGCGGSFDEISSV